MPMQFFGRRREDKVSLLPADTEVATYLSRKAATLEALAPCCLLRLASVLV